MSASWRWRDRMCPQRSEAASMDRVPRPLSALVAARLDGSSAGGDPASSPATRQARRDRFRRGVGDIADVGERSLDGCMCGRRTRSRVVPARKCRRLNVTPLRYERERLAFWRAVWPSKTFRACWREAAWFTGSTGGVADRHKVSAPHGRPASQLGKLMAAVESEFRTDVLKLGADELRPCCDVPGRASPGLGPVRR